MRPLRLRVTRINRIRHLNAVTAGSQDSFTSCFVDIRRVGLFTESSRSAGPEQGGFPGAPNVQNDLTQAMITNPRLLVEVENGYFDSATPFFETEFTMQHLGLPAEFQDHIQLKYYQAGHMMYLQDESRVQLHDNIAKFIDRATQADRK